MRTTVTLDDDTVAVIRRVMLDRGVSFDQALNDVIREGVAQGPASTALETRSTALGVPTVNLDRALQLAAELEDEELIRRQLRGE